MLRPNQIEIQYILRRRRMSMRPAKNKQNINRAVKEEAPDCQTRGLERNEIYTLQKNIQFYIDFTFRW